MPTQSPTTVPHNRWSQRIVLVLAVAVVAPVGASILYSNSPVERVGIASYYPGCVMQSVTGLHCPGCGATRSVHALLHADLPQAFAWNPLFVLGLPFIAYSLWRFAFTIWTGRPAPGPFLRQRGTWVVLTIIAAFSIARNVPVPESYINPLAPHPLLPSDPPAPPQSPTP